MSAADDLHLTWLRITFTSRAFNLKRTSESRVASAHRLSISLSPRRVRAATAEWPPRRLRLRSSRAPTTACPTCASRDTACASPVCHSACRSQSARGPTSCASLAPLSPTRRPLRFQPPLVAAHSHTMWRATVTWLQDAVCPATTSASLAIRWVLLAHRVRSPPQKNARGPRLYPLPSRRSRTRTHSRTQRRRLSHRLLQCRHRPPQMRPLLHLAQPTSLLDSLLVKLRSHHPHRPHRPRGHDISTRCSSERVLEGKVEEATSRAQVRVFATTRTAAGAIGSRACGRVRYRTVGGRVSCAPMSATSRDWRLQLLPLRL